MLLLFGRSRSALYLAAHEDCHAILVEHVMDNLGHLTPQIIASKVHVIYDYLGNILSFAATC